MEIVELGALLRSRRSAAGRTIASVALEAGLSVPYVANLENGRGNPTLSAVHRLAAALGLRLVVEPADGAGDQPVPLPESLVRFARSPRFRAEAARFDQQRLLRAMAAMGALSPDPADQDWHRLLDAALLMTRSRGVSGGAFP
jgi:transcriptional regulator with XRE-family HTH domain